MGGAGWRFTYGFTLPPSEKDYCNYLDRLQYSHGTQHIMPVAVLQIAFADGEEGNPRVVVNGVPPPHMHSKVTSSPSLPPDPRATCTTVAAHAPIHIHRTNTTTALINQHRPTHPHTIHTLAPALHSTCTQVGGRPATYPPPSAPAARRPLRHIP